MVEPAEARRAALEARLGEPITCDSLTGSWSILQRAKGHRHSTDDVLTAYYALVHGPRTDAALDLGTGIGTVGLLVLHGLGEDATLTCVEAQEISFTLLRENLALNGLEDRVRPTHGDLRHVRFDRRFSLVTGSPPYFDVGAGVLPPDSQKAHARFELRGTVHDYAAAAIEALSDDDDARFVFCFPTAQKARAFRAIHEHGLSAVAHRDVIPRAGRAALFSLFSCRRGDHPEHEEAPLVVRDAEGRHTEELREVRRTFGFVA
jgi:tRNA1(Val) A37 N6-methylase TrmN6